MSRLRSELCTIGYYLSSVYVCMNPVDFQPALLGAFSISILVVRRRDVGDLEKTPTTTLLDPSVPALAPVNSRNQTATRVGKQTVSRSAQQAGSNGLRHAAGRRASGGEQLERERVDAEERSRLGLGALKNTGSRRRVPRSASPAHAASRQCASRQLQPAAAPDLGRYCPSSPASPIICRGSSNSSLLVKSAITTN